MTYLTANRSVDMGILFNEIHFFKHNLQPNCHRIAHRFFADWADVERNRPKFLRELHHALTNIGFLVLKNAPGLDDKVQRRLFKSAR